MSSISNNHNLFSRESILLGLPSTDKYSAIRQTGELLVALGSVTPAYIDSMIEREKEVSIYMGSGLALPHCTNSGRAQIINSGLVVLQYPDGIDFGDEKAYILVGIAGAGDDHLEILSKVATIFMECDEESLKKLFTTTDIEYVYKTIAL
ncbi:MAG: PTS sugar transporter subunit IIA [Eubacteriales bacterium]